MDSAPHPSSFNKTIFWLAFAVVVLHILIGAQYVFIKKDILPGKLHSFYSKLVVLGPFFSANRIKISPHVFIRYAKKSGQWSAPHDYGAENLRLYQQNPLRYDKLKWSDYERYLMRKAYNTMKALSYIDGEESKETRELIDYVLRISPTLQQADSIQLQYVWNTWSASEGLTKMDTTAIVVYKSKTNAAIQ